MSVSIPRSLDDLPVVSPRWIGQPMERVEDPLLLTAKAAFIDNLTPAGMVHCAILRSPHAHARIRSIDVSEAEQLPGVVAVITGADARARSNRLSGNPSGFSDYCIAVDKVRFVGEPVAAVAATSRYVAEDALDLIRVEYEVLPAVTDPIRALSPDSPRLFEDRESNVVYQRQFTWGDVDAAFAEADHVFTDKFRWHRVSGNPMETFGCISQWDTTGDAVTSWGSFQAPVFGALGVAADLNLPSNKVRLIGQPHGGSFGTKSNAWGIAITALLSRKAGGRPVKWIEDRLEHLAASGTHAWDRIYEASIAVKDDGTVTSFKVKMINDLGAYSGALGPGMSIKPLVQFTGCYRIPTAAYDVTVVATNKNPEGAYRGYGPPPQNFVLEQLMDLAARGLAMDPVEIRRRNFIQPDQFPYTIPSGNEYDSGNYEAALDKVLEMADYEALRREQAEARRQGRYVGIGLASTIETGAFGMSIYTLIGPVGGTSTPEGASVRIDATGRVIVQIGFPLEGQGQPTFVTQLMADYFGVEPDQVEVITVDSLTASTGFGPGGSRLAVALSGAVLGAAERVADKLRKMAANLLEANPVDVELMDGKLRVKGVPGKELPLAAVVGAMMFRSDLLPPDVDGSPEATYVWNAAGRTLPDEQGRAKSYLTAANACHLVMLEVDPDTGQVEILKYFIADDCGTRLNPAVVEGMIQGGLAQGLGAALLEEYVYDDNGQLLTSTYMDYLLPTIHDVPTTVKAALVTPSPFTPLGTKGTGEGAIHTTPAAIFGAINDALEPLGVRATEVPATPVRLWKLIQHARLTA